MKISFYFSTFILFAALLTGCNVFEGTQEEGTGDDPEVLLQDAEAALQRDEPKLAVAYLKRAVELEPVTTSLGAQIRIQLSTAHLRAVGVNIMTLKQLATPFTEIPESIPAGASFDKAEAIGCKFPSSHQSTIFDPRNNNSAATAYYQLGETPTTDAINEAGTLINRVFQLNETEASQEFPCDPTTLDNTIASLQGFLTDELIAQALVNYSVVLTTLSFKDVVDEGGIADVNGVQFRYVFPSGQNPYVSSCMPDLVSCEVVTTTVQNDLDDLACSALLLDRRADLLTDDTGSIAEEVADLAETAQQALASGLNENCYEHP